MTELDRLARMMRRELGPAKGYELADFARATNAVLTALRDEPSEGALTVLRAALRCGRSLEDGLMMYINHILTEDGQ